MAQEQKDVATLRGNRFESPLGSINTPAQVEEEPSITCRLEILQKRLEVTYEHLTQAHGKLMGPGPERDNDARKTGDHGLISLLATLDKTANDVGLVAQSILKCI